MPTTVPTPENLDEKAIQTLRAYLGRLREGWGDRWRDWNNGSRSSG